MRKKGRAKRSAASARGDRTREIVILLACVLVSLLVHSPFVVDGFGEADTARLAVLAMEWHHTGGFSHYTYALRTSPLYIQWIKLLLDVGVSPARVPATLNWLSAVIGSLTLISLYYLWRNLLGRRAAVVACVLLFFSPAYWLANVYGMAHLPAFGCFVLSLLLFQMATGEKAAKRVLLLCGSAAAGITAVTLKADLIICYGAYLGIAYFTRSLDRRSVVAAGIAVPALSLAAVAVYTSSITTGIPPLTSSAVNWAHTFPFTIESVRDGENRAVLFNTVGWFFFAAVVVSCGYCIARRSHRRLLVLAALWALPGVLFWGLKMGNSARHMLTPFCALLAVVAAVAVAVFKRDRWLVPAVGALVIANYFVGAREGGTTSPSSRLREASRAVHVYSHHRTQVARAFAAFNAERKAYFGHTTVPYVAWEAMAAADDVRIPELDPVVYFLARRDGYSELLRLTIVDPPCEIPPMRDWLTFSFEAGIRTSSFLDQVEQKKRLTDYMKKLGLMGEQAAMEKGNR